MSIPEVRNRMMFFNTDPRVNPYIFTESKDSIINDIPLNQIVLITAPSGFFHDIQILKYMIRLIMLLAIFY